MRGAWIEIVYSVRNISAALSLPMRGAWIEIEAARNYADANQSLPMRGAWIEISGGSYENLGTAVAPHAGSVD